MKSSWKFSQLIKFIFVAGVFGEPRRRSVPSTAGAQHFDPPTAEPVAAASGSDLVQQPLAESTLPDAECLSGLSDLADVLVRWRGR
jgi:hypothetical protein